jgi:hypothetical protein
MAKRHSLACLEAYCLKARPVEIGTNRWLGRGSEEQRPRTTTVRQVYDHRPHTIRLHLIKLTDTDARSEQADVQVPNHAHGLDMPSARPRRCGAPRLTNVVGDGLFATRVLAIATAPVWSQWSLGQWGNDLGGEQ